jgi:ArsR family transcriptional regulator
MPGSAFADEAVIGWMAGAGLEARVAEHLEGGELTVTLWEGEQPETRLKVVA